MTWDGGHRCVPPGTSGALIGDHNKRNQNIEYGRDERLCSVEPIRSNTVHAQCNQLVEPRHHQSRAMLTYTDYLRGFYIVGVEEPTGVEPLMEPGRILPEHLIDHIVSVEVERGGRYPPLGLSPAKSVRGQNHYVAHADEMHTKLAEQSSSARSYDYELEAVESDRLNRRNRNLCSGEER